MKLMEYQAKSIFSDYGILIQKGFIADTTEGLDEKLSALNFPIVIKARFPQEAGEKPAGLNLRKPAKKP